MSAYGTMRQIPVVHCPLTHGQLTARRNESHPYHSIQAQAHAVSIVPSPPIRTNSIAKHGFTQPDSRVSTGNRWASAVSAARVRGKRAGGLTSRGRVLLLIIGALEVTGARSRSALSALVLIANPQQHALRGGF